MSIPSSHFSQHADLLYANPETGEEKAKMIEELKYRGRGAMKAESYLEADVLYGKGIEVAKDDATLHANRAAARIGMYHFAEARKDAENAMKIDHRYAKALYRLGQASLGLKMFSDATWAFEKGQVVEPNNKSWAVQLAKVKEMEKKHAEMASKSPDPPKKKTVIRTETITEDTKKKEEESSTKKSMTAQDEGDLQLKEARGYRKTKDGRVTTYFNNELSEEDKRLIGDIAPKKLDPSVTPVVEPVSTSSTQSAWNIAGTWEERDTTERCKAMLKKLLIGISVDAGDGIVQTTGAVINGDSQITTSRGKQRNLFEFDLKINWEVELDCGTAKGTISYPDFGYDGIQDEDWECTIHVDNSSPTSSRNYVDRFIKNEKLGLRPAVLQRFRQFIEDHNK